MYRGYANYNYMERIEEQRYRRMSRIKEVRRNKIYLTIGLFITILLIMIFSIKAFVYANDNTINNDGVKMYRSQVIYCGDSVEKIAHDNYIKAGYSTSSSYEKEIRSINHLSDNSILIPGNYIVVPYYN